MPTVRAALVLLAAGSGTRVAAPVNKVLLPLAGRPVLAWSLADTAGLPTVVTTLVVTRDQDRHAVEVLTAASSDRPVGVVVGGATRHASELAALRVLEPLIRRGDVDVVVIHDAARPLAGTRLFADVIDSAHESGGALPVLPQPGLLSVGPAVAAGDLVTVQTPQAFRAMPLLTSYLAAATVAFDATDTAGCVARFSDLRVRALPGSAANIKITYPEDLALAERLLALSRR